jgi:hypothetical protein
MARQLAPADRIWSGPACAVGGLLTLVSIVTVLLSLFGSNAAPETTAVFVNIPGALARAAMVTRAMPDSDGQWHVITFVPVQLPKLPTCVADTSVAPAGNVSVSVAAVIIAGPWFSTSNV